MLKFLSEQHVTVDLASTDHRYCHDSVNSQEFKTHVRGEIEASEETDHTGCKSDDIHGLCKAMFATVLISDSEMQWASKEFKIQNGNLQQRVEPCNVRCCCDINIQDFVQMGQLILGSIGLGRRSGI